MNAKYKATTLAESLKVTQLQVQELGLSLAAATERAEQLQAELATVFEQTREKAAKVAEAAWPHAHTYGSENASMYRAQDHAAATCVKAIRAMQKDLLAPANAWPFEVGKAT